MEMVGTVDSSVLFYKGEWLSAKVAVAVGQCVLGFRHMSLSVRNRVPELPDVQRRCRVHQAPRLSCGVASPRGADVKVFPPKSELV